jgi:subtilisin family serine protease
LFFVVVSMMAVGIFGKVGHNARAATPIGETKSVIVRLKQAAPVSSMDAGTRVIQQQSIKEMASVLNSSISTGYAQQTRDYTSLPYVIYRVDANGEAALKTNPNVLSVEEDRWYEPLTDTPIPTIGGVASTGFSDGTTNYTGTGYSVAILDTGVDKSHPLLAGKVVSEACFSESGDYPNVTVESLCPGGANSSTAVDSALPCATLCNHGTQVAGAATMSYTNSYDISGDSIADPLSGVAKNANIISVQIYSKLNEKPGYDICGDGVGTVSSCVRSGSSEQLAAMDYIANLSLAQPIAAVNLSAGGSPFALTDAECTEGSSFNVAANVLRSHNIATIVAAGNSGDNPSYVDKIASPACSSDVIAVAATNIKGTAIASYSNNGPLTDLLAPGGDFDGTNADTFMWLPHNGTSNLTYGQGTSFAAPMVAGAYAVLREAHPNATVNQLTTLLQTTGTSVTDNRAGYTVGAKKMIKLDAALAAAKKPAITTYTGPVTKVNEGANMNLQIAATDSTSCSLNNGVGTVSGVTSTPSAHSVPAASSYVLTCTGPYNDTVSQTLNFTINAAPTAPANLQGTGDDNARSYTVNWAGSTDTDGIQEYQVYLNGNLIATLAASALSYTATNLQLGQSYSLEVRAVDTLGAMSLAASSSFNLQAAQSTGTPGVPNTGGMLLESVQSWKLWLLVIGALASAYTLRVAGKARK